MQPAPNEFPQNAPLDHLQNISSSHNHGIYDGSDEPSGRVSTPEDERRRSQSPEDADAASVASSRTRRGRRANTGRLRHDDRSPQEGSPGSRIEEYERSQITAQRPSGDVTFKIIPSTKDGNSRISVDDFPNEVLTHILSNLSPETLSAMSLVSKRFHKLITTPHAWRIAFTRYFPGRDDLSSSSNPGVVEAQDDQRSEKRVFSRLSALASWRSEYILRTRLLRSLYRGKPALQAPVKGHAPRNASATHATAVTTYGSGLLYPVSHIHAVFGMGLNKKQPLFMHGAVEQGIASISDPAANKIGSWGLADFENFKHFTDLYIGEAEYGLGSGDVVGMSNVMDVSYPYGKVYGEACPGGRVFYTSVNEQRGRFLSATSSPDHEAGIPDVNMTNASVSSVWIAKSEAVLKVTSGLFGFLAGYSNGVLAAYALGVNPVHDRRFEKGQRTASWVLSPGVPLVGIRMDDKFSFRRQAQGRIWAVVLNALGEIFYLTDVPIQPTFKGKPGQRDLDRLAWQTGRSVGWTLVESTRRTARPDPFNTASVDASYTPSSSADAAGLSREQTVAETKEIEQFLRQKPKHFQTLCDGWDMRRKLIVDFGGDDKHGAGESVFVVACGLDEGQTSSIRRFTRRKTKAAVDFDLDPYPTIQSTTKRASPFGSSTTPWAGVPAAMSPTSMPRSRASSNDNINDALYSLSWHISNFSFGGFRGLEISATAMDESDYASLPASEDPLLGMSGASNVSSPSSSPLGPVSPASSTSEIPGSRARFFAVGTTTGVVLLWNMRAGLSSAPDVINSVQPLHMIHTKSPQISSLALTALYLVHGGNDGLVQAWDVLASMTEPVRTLNSRFSDRARRRIAQAEASIHGVGNNYYAAGAVVLDPDPSVLRGMVSLGTHLRYWSFSATAADAYRSKKRGQLRRRSERGSNSASAEQKYSHTGRGVLKDYIANEQVELQREKVMHEKEAEKLSGRFGTDILGPDASEEEIMAYATMLSTEAWSNDESKRQSSGESTTITSQCRSSNGEDIVQNELSESDLKRAIHLSLMEDEQVPSTEIPIRYTKSVNPRTPQTKLHHVRASSSKHPSTAAEDSDLDFALQLSLAEEQSRVIAAEDFPALSSASPSSSSSDSGKAKPKKKKGKGRAT